MRKLILAALVAAAFSIPAFATQTTPASSADQSMAKTEAPMKADHKAAKHHTKKASHHSRHHAKKAESAPASSGK